MAEYVSAAPWLHTIGSSGTVTPSRLKLRSLSPPSLNKQVTKSVSTPQLGKRAHSSPLVAFDSDVLNTIPDPRTATPECSLSRSNSTDASPHPDLSQEVATLSTKLVNAINHQDTLDNALQRTRQELDATRERLEEYEKRVMEHEKLVQTGRLVEKEVFDKMEKQLLSDLEDERKRRRDAEKAKRKVDSEVETLTSALFEEANTMVAAARKETEAAEKRNDQLKQQLADAEILQLSLQEQLQDLKSVMEKMSERDDMESNTLATTTAPSTPGITPADKLNKLFEAANLTPNTPGSDEIAPEHPLHFHHLIHPVLRTDLPSFRDFEEMIWNSTRSAPSSRVSSGNYGGLNVLGLGALTNNSTSSLPAASRSPSSNGGDSRRDSTASTTASNLKDEKFYKRALSEDIEPTLRLDIAPGLSWMARRTVINSITAGSLVIEPAPPPQKFRGPVFPCSLCGECRKGDEYARKYRFKSSETDETKHPLCDWCVNRMRATCDYIGFLRMIAAGHWRAETEAEKKNAWEESVRLRERMFWSRVGGGVVPAFLPTKESPTSPAFATKDGQTRTSEESQLSDAKALDSAVDMTQPTKRTSTIVDDPFRSKEEDKAKRVSIGKTIIMNEGATEGLTPAEERKIEKEVNEQLHNEVRRSIEAKREGGLQRTRAVSTSISPLGTPKKKDERLSLTIPGAFE
ncbi:Sec2p-domain-containing protein [Westerdykella ornata]|uniref:Sec2p-domain-containing protein n=1 Tax=Westerdykella ornata TaxID=318751 RepID=A0A6A6JFH9_WESOR|nr:Sec2p-domain-containing protein [Westerdykella ornata]KAF2275087.1 Sec2p-domain-containing protein [Westerdykella ornata]